MKKVVPLILGLLVAVLLLLAIRRSPPPESSVLGKPLSTWALELNNAATHDGAAAIFAQIKSNSAPALARMLRTPDPVLARPVRAIGSRAPKKFALTLFRVVNPFDAPAKRAAAAQALRLMGRQADPAVPELSRALKEDQTVSWHAALALAQCGEPGIRALTNALTAVPDAQRGFVCYALGTQGPAASNAIPALAAVLRTGPPEVASKAAHALSCIGRAAVPVLLRCLTENNTDLQVFAIDALATMAPRPRDCLTQLIEAARSGQPAARRAAVRALALLQPRASAVVAALTRAVADPVAAVRLEALQGLAGCPLESNDVLSALLAALDDPVPEVRGQAAITLGEAQAAAERVAPILARHLVDENEAVRVKARQALDKLQRGVTSGVDKSKGPGLHREEPMPPKSAIP